MFDPTRVYAIDIETDTSGGFGLDPENGAITEIAIEADPGVIPGGGLTLGFGDEAKTLDALQEVLEALPPGLITTWNGTNFDFPFIASRARINAAAMSTPLGLRLDPVPGLPAKYDYLPGHESGYQVTWLRGGAHGGALPHAHLDISFPYKRVAADLGVKWRLKDVGAALGIDMISLDRERMHDYSPEQIRAYARSDTRGTRLLALHHLGLAPLASAAAQAL